MLTLVGAWIPADLALADDPRLSLLKTGFSELMLVFALMFAVYGCIAYSIYRHASGEYRTYIVPFICVGVLVSGTIYLFTPGTLTTDMYSYASYGRLLSIYFVNPYFVPPSAFPGDGVYQWLYWKDTVSVYGPIWLLVSGALSWLSGTQQMELILTFRLFAFAAHLLNIYCVYRTLRTLGQPSRLVLVGTFLYAWNPLVLMESALGAHNDVFMVTFILFGLYLCARAEKRSIFRLPQGYLPPVLAFTAATLVKFSAAVAIAVCILALFCLVARAPQRLGGKLAWQAAFKAVAIASVVCAIFTLAFYGPFWFGHSISEISTSFSSQPSANDAINSFQATFNYHRYHVRVLPEFLYFLTDRKLWSTLMLLAVSAPLIAGSYLLWYAPTTRNIAFITLASLVGFLLFTPWSFSWYIVWLIGPAVICLPTQKASTQVGRLTQALLAFVFCFSATALFTYCSTTVGSYLLNRQNPPGVSWAIWMNLGTIGIPVLIFCAFYFIRLKKVEELLPQVPSLHVDASWLDEAAAAVVSPVDTTPDA